MTPARYILLLALVSFFALLAVAQRAHGVYLGRRLSLLQHETEVLSEHNSQLLCEISALSDPARIAGEVERMKLPLLGPVELSKALVPHPEEGEPTRKTPPTRR